MWLAIGAVRPSATIFCTKARRDTLPTFTCAMRPRSACSSMLSTPLQLDLVRPQISRFGRLQAPIPGKQNSFARYGQRRAAVPSKEAAALQQWANAVAEVQ